MKASVFEKSSVAAAAEAPGMRRLNLNLPQKAYDEVALLSKTHQRSMTEIFRIGIALVKIALDASANGSKLTVTDAEGKSVKEVVIP
jgi:hypothetical protein